MSVFMGQATSKGGILVTISAVLPGWRWVITLHIPHFPPLVSSDFSAEQFERWLRWLDIPIEAWEKVESHNA